MGETLRAALNTLATVAPDWLRSWVPLEWFDRYGRAVEEYRLPSSSPKSNFLYDCSFHPFLQKHLNAICISEVVLDLGESKTMVASWARLVTSLMMFSLVKKEKQISHVTATNGNDYLIGTDYSEYIYG